jgi:beta-phosphoglucomutase-like phosphatase (HAD superfamily)
VSALNDIVERVRAVAASGRLPVVVFDLDSTLIDTSHRHLRILREYALTRDDPALAEIVARLVPGDFGYEVTGPLEAHGWQEPAALDALRAFWWPRFFHQDYARTDLPTPGAPAYVRRVHEAGGFVVYLSARAIGDQGLATIESLLTLGFPILGPRAMVHLKPDASVRDTLFKHGAVDDVRALGGEVVATFENEPAHANHFAACFPDATHVLLDTCHAPGAPAPDAAVRVVPNFQDT